MADLYQCRCDATWLTDAQGLENWCMKAATAAGLEPLHPLFHSSAATAGGVTGAVLLADSHLCVHTWPEQRAVTLDVYIGQFAGDHSAKARSLMDALVDRFMPEWTEQRSLDRGDGLA